MVEVVSAFINISESLSFLEEQEKEYQSITNSASLKDHTLSLKLGLRFLERFLSFSNDEDFKMSGKLVVFHVRRELHSLSHRPINQSLILDLDCVYTNLREKIKNVFNPENREYYVPKSLSWDRDLRKTSGFLLECFGDYSSCKSDLIAPSIKEKLLLVQALLTYVVGRNAYFSEENKKLLSPFAALLDNALRVLFPISVGKMDEEMALAIGHNLSILLEKDKVKEIYMVFLRVPKVIESTDNPLKSEFDLLDILIKLLDSNASSVIYLNDLSEKLHRMLKFLQTFLMDLPHELRVEKFNFLATSVEVITCEAILILYSCYDEVMAGKVNGALSKVVDEIKHIQDSVKEIKLYNYPKTDGLGFLDLFLGHLEELQKCRPELIEILKNHIETLHVEFNFLRSFLKIFKEKRNEHEELEDLWTRIINLAYLAELVIDIYLVKDALDSRIMLSLSKIIEQTKLIKSEVTMIYDEEKYHTQIHNVPSKSIDTTTDEVVGFEDEAKKIMEYLFGYSKQLDVVSIVGMPGLGKSTLAKKIYEAPSIQEHFDVRAWCSVSQTYQKRELLLTILGDVITLTDEISKLNDEELAAKLYQSLKGCRYLIIIDDLWDINAWNDLKRSLPNDKNYSRILITSRLQNVASQTKVGSKVHPLRKFSDSESWELFQKKLLEKECFSPEFWDVGQQIAQSCKGLPLAIVVIVGILAKVEKSILKWKQIAASLSSHILSDSQSQCKAILELSYNHLPDHLRSCFLYFGAFLEDEEIPIWKLKWLWIAEGFVQNNEGKSLEDVAEEYVMEFVSRSLVIATKERSRGGVKACRVHDLLRDFCLDKAKEESFLLVIHVDHWSKFSRAYDEYRLSIYSKVDDLMKVKPSGHSVRSLLYTGAESFEPQDVAFIFWNFRLLRVLDLACINIGESFSGIELLIHLRYLAIGAVTTSIPPSIANLWNLQFFLVKPRSRYVREVVHVPDSLWDMVNLRHVHINHRASLDIHSSRLENSSLLNNLETLSTPCFSSKEDAENILRRLPKLQKLRCVFLDCWDDSTNCYQFPALDFLDQLVSLKVIFDGSLHWRQKCEFNFPSNLQKLTLSNFQISWNDISKIGRTLPNLKVLKLIGRGRYYEWIVNDGDFPKLKYLKLSSLYIPQWIASEDSFPNIEQLVMDNCRDLDEIPLCFGEILTLRMITLRDCEPSIDDSARRIQREQHEELQNMDFKVYIYPRKQ